VHPAGRRTLLLSSSSSALLCAGPLFGKNIGDAATDTLSPPPPPPPPRPLALPPPPFQVAALACGWEHALLLCVCGALFSVGAGARGRLGLGDERDVGAPARVPLPGRALAAAAGGAHSAALVAGGGLFAWGCGRFGALGGGACAPAALAPAPVAAADRLLAPGEAWAALACGWAHTLALSGGGGVAAWGANRHGQCGAPPCRAAPPAWVRGLPRAAAVVAAGWTHSAAGAPGGGACVWTWGRGDLGQLGRGGAREAPGPVDAAVCACGGSGGALRLACGAESTAAVLPCGACAWSWGWNEHGNVGGGGPAAAAAEPCKLPLPARATVGALRAAGATLFVGWD
jgi:alpha-tubulin suppressor-like RCC1 family protein